MGRVVLSGGRLDRGGCIVNRIMLIVMVVTAVSLHFSFCEWDACQHEPIVPASRSGRVLFYHYDRAGHDYYVMSKSAASYDDALLYGVWVPLLVLGGCVVVYRMECGAAGS